MNSNSFIKFTACLTLLFSTTNYTMFEVPHRETAQAISIETFFITYPIYVMAHQLELMTTSTPNAYVPYAPLGVLGHQRVLPDASITWLPSPALDFLYSSAWLDLSKQCYVLQYPAVTDRYLCWEVKDATLYPFQVLSPNTRGTGAGNYLLVSETVSDYLNANLPAWYNLIPHDWEIIVIPSNYAWLMGRTEVRNVSDVYAVNALQDQYSLKAIDQIWNSNHPIVKAIRESDLPTPVAYNFNPNVPTELKFFDEVGQYLRNTPLKPDEAKYWFFLPRIGFTPEGLDLTHLDAATIQGMTEGLALAQQVILPVDQMEWGRWINGWTMAKDMSVGNDYIHWCTYCTVAKTALPPYETVYSFAFTDATGMPLNGQTNTYAIHFVTPPPVKNLWSITLYDMQERLVANPINRYHLGTNTPSLEYNQDGSLDIYVQREQPAEHVGNWLPAPSIDFMLEIRLFGPQEHYYRDEWQEPPILKTN